MAVASERWIDHLEKIGAVVGVPWGGSVAAIRKYRNGGELAGVEVQLAHRGGAGMGQTMRHDRAAETIGVHVWRCGRALSGAGGGR